MTPGALTGVLPVVSTPFDATDDIDAEVLAGEVDWLISCGVDGLVVAMVSEVLRLSEAERRALTSAVVVAAGGRVPVVASVGAESTKAAVAFAVHAERAGAAALMAIPPVAVELKDAEIAAYFGAILQAVEIPLVVQDASGYLGRPLSLDLYLGLLDEHGPDRVLFKPEAPPTGPRLSALRDATGGRARVFEGTGGAALVDSHRRGVVGTMPGPEVAWAVVELWRALARGDAAAVAAIHGPLAGLVSLQTSLDAFVAAEKHLLVRQGVFVSDLRRRPYGYVLDAETIIEIDRLFRLLCDAVPARPIPSSSPR